jgi:hypothetical protein
VQIRQALLHLARIQGNHFTSHFLRRQTSHVGSFDGQPSPVYHLLYGRYGFDIIYRSLMVGLHRTHPSCHFPLLSELHISSRRPMIAEADAAA